MRTEKEKLEQINKHYLFRDAQNALVGDVLARVEICRRTGLNNKNLTFSKNEYGKPILDNQLQIHYNISHSANYVACVIDNQPVGIDIEEFKSVNMKVAKRFFAQDEIDYIYSAKANERFIRLYEIWTIKESYVKWKGVGFSELLTSFSVFITRQSQNVYYHKVYENKNAIVHVCSVKHNTPSIRHLGVSELINCYAS